jgi:transcriptional regulator with XRE-family HTH domain
MAHTGRVNPKKWIEIGERLRLARQAAKLKQAEVALELHRSRQSVSAWERGHPLTLDELVDAAVLYGVSADWLLLGIETVPVGGRMLQDIFREHEASQADWPAGL